MRPELDKNKFQERPSGAASMQGNLLAAGALPWIMLHDAGRAYSAPQPLAGGNGAGCPLFEDIYVAYKGA